MQGGKPSIDSVKLPTWAAWVAQDADGAWWAYEHEPNEGAISWYENEVGRGLLIGKEQANPNWRETLRKIVQPL